MSSPETVRFYTYDQNGDALPGVLIRIFDVLTSTLVTQQYSAMVGDDAIAEVTLDGDTPAISYTVRISKTGVAFDGSQGTQSKTPQLITVYSPPDVDNPNDFDLIGETFERPTATDPRLCRVSSFFKDITGRPLVGLEIKFINEFGPAIVDGYGVLGEGVSITTDKNGYALIDLYRFGKYSAWVSSVQTVDSDSTHAIGFPRYIEIPDQSSANMVDLLFPIIKEIEFTPGDFVVPVNGTMEITTVVTADDGRVLTGTACNDVYYDITNKNVAGISAMADKIYVTGIAPGTTTLTAVRKDQTIVKIPSVGIIGQPISVTVV